MSFTFDLINVCNSKLFFTSYIAIQEKIRKNLVLKIPIIYYVSIIRLNFIMSIKNFYVKKIQMIQLKNYLLAHSSSSRVIDFQRIEEASMVSFYLFSFSCAQIMLTFNDDIQSSMCEVTSIKLRN
ncbi:unnamed protein product [Rhizophagus irregularis]|nr:unnamed protein product [Rhizophagus irregularis]